jgi:translin
MNQAVPVTLDELKQRLNEVGESVHLGFSEMHGARERALRLSREIIRNSANSIRAIHRGEFDNAREMITTVSGFVQEIEEILEEQPSIYHAGFVEDAQKEYVESCATLAFAEGSYLPGMDELGVGPAAYINGLAEAIGELRRFILDSLRRDDFSRCEELLELMDEVYTILVSMDFPDAVTRGLRRNTDAMRGVLERTRGDLTVALHQRRLEQRLTALAEASGDNGTRE